MDYRAELIAHVQRNGKRGFKQIGDQQLRYKVGSDLWGTISLTMDFSTASQGYILFRSDYPASFTGKTARDFAVPADRVREGFRLCNQLTRDHAFCSFILDENRAICGSLIYEFGACFEPEACYKLARHFALHLERAYSQITKAFPFFPHK